MLDFLYDTCYSEGVMSQIKPVDVKIYYENKQPWIDYVGEAIGSDGNKWTIHIPKIGLSFNNFTYKMKQERYGGLITNFKLEAFATTDEDVLFTITEREMTKEQIEKEIGCKVKIKER